MTLENYLHEAQTSPAQFARAIKRSRQTVSRYLKGRIPDSETIVRIALATGGKVTANDFYGIAA